MKRKRILWYLLILLVVSGCISETPPTPTVSPIPSETPTITPTIMWFPPTETLTPIPTTQAATPTAELRPNIGSILFEDDFSEPEKWSLSSSGTTSAAISNNKLTLALSRSNAFLLTTRLEPTLGNFYAEISASPNLCNPQDEFGVLIRASASLDYFRFGLTCDGQARLDRIRGGTQGVFETPQTFGVIPTTLFTERRIGVWANGETIRLFVNGQLIYTTRDTVFYRGAFGVYVKTSQDGGISVNFSDLVVYQINSE